MSYTCRVDNMYKYSIYPYPFPTSFFFSLFYLIFIWSRGRITFVDRDVLLSHQQFIANDNIFWANNKNNRDGDVVNNWTARRTRFSILEHQFRQRLRGDRKLNGRKWIPGVYFPKVYGNGQRKVRMPECLSGPSPLFFSFSDFWLLPGS